jgi:uncharacterized protein YoxC
MWFRRHLMDCIECQGTNPDGNRFCGQCGAELGRSLEETVRRKGFRDRQATEIEITESVAKRLMKWASWLGKIAALIVVLFGLLLGKSYWDVWTAVREGKAKIETAVREGTKDIDAVRRETTELNKQVKQLQSEIGRYKQVNSEIEKLQKEFNAVQGQMIDLGKRSLRVQTLETSGPGPSQMAFNVVGCPPSTERVSGVVYCVQGSPLSLFQLTSTGERRPVSSLSPVGFQDASIAPKPPCTAGNRGTFYVEKGAGKVADKPFLCAKQSDNTYAWIQLGIIP